LDDSKISDDQISKQISNHIAILLRSYTRAINIQEDRTGSLFQQKTKAKCLNEKNESPNNYVVTCFNYIHQNPFTTNLVKNLEDWEFSSFLDYSKLRNGTFCNQKLAYEMINFDRKHFIEQAYAILEEKNLKGIWV
jgi:putative transposase